MALRRKLASSPIFGGRLLGGGELNYRQLAEQLPSAFFLASPQTGLFLYVNHKAIELTGFSRGQLSRLSLAELFSSGDAADALEVIHSLEAGSTRRLLNVPVQCWSGKPAPVDLNLSVVQSDGEKLVVMTAEPAERRLQLEQEAARRADSLAAIDQLLMLLVCSGSGTLSDVLVQCRRLLHADCVALYQRTIEPAGLCLLEGIELPPELPRLLAPADPAASGVPLSWRASERSPAVTSAMTRSARAAGLSALYTHPVGDGGGSLGMVVVGYRLAEAAAVEAGVYVSVAARYLTAWVISQQWAQLIAGMRTRLAMAEAQLRTILSGTSEGILRIDARGAVQELNAAAESLLGFTSTDTAHEPLEDVLVAAQPLAAPLLAALRRGLRWGGVEADLVRRDGHAAPVLVRAVPLVDDRGQPDGGLVLLTDRTDQRHFQAQSDHLERRAWLGDLSAIFAHDVRNPLNGISTGLAYLAGKFEPMDPLSDAVGKMQAEITRIDQLLKNVLLVARSAELNYQPVSLDQLLDRTLARWLPRLARLNIQLERFADPETPRVLADVHQMDQVFTNLIVNAVEAMTLNGGTLSIKCRRAQDEQTPRGEYVEVLIGDTGPGVSPELLAHIFDPFITTKAGGTGLGLAITRRIVNAHKGHIYPKSFAGIGTVFVMFLPVANGHPDTEPEVDGG